jgi:hypothetical protein
LRRQLSSISLSLLVGSRSSSGASGMADYLRYEVLRPDVLDELRESRLKVYRCHHSVLPIKGHAFSSVQGETNMFLLGAINKTPIALGC